jgi:membrane protein required for colicin V production
MGWIDIILGILLILNIIDGYKNGFFEEIGTFAGLIAGICAGIALKGQIAVFFINHSSSSAPWANILGFLVPFLLVFLFFVIMAKVMSHFFKAISMGWLNRMAGGLFCMLKGALILSLVLNLYQIVDRDRSIIGAQRAESSLLYEPIVRFAPKVFPSLRGMFHYKDYDKEKKPQTI